MIEIGLQRVVPVMRRNAQGKLQQAMDPDGSWSTRLKNVVVTRITRNELDGTFGRDRGRKLVVSLQSIDRLCLRPMGTRQVVDAPLAEIYRWMLMRRATRHQLEKARERKAVKQQQRARRSLDRAEQRLRKQAREEQHA